MYGFWRLGVMPLPSAGAIWVANGLSTRTTSSAKKVATPPSAGTTQATTSSPTRRPMTTAAAPRAVSTSSQNSSEPSCPPQNAESAYGSGRSLLVSCAT
jgi:hypothetical protein